MENETKYIKGENIWNSVENETLKIYEKFLQNIVEYETQIFKTFTAKQTTLNFYTKF